MYTESYRNTHPCGGGYSGGGYSGGGPAYLYGYCHDSGRMRMMNMPDYMRNMQTGYTNMAQAPATLMQQMAAMVASPTSMSGYNSNQGYQEHHGEHHRHHPHKKHGCRCGGDERDDCGCECCIRCADTVEYARCGETRKVPITFDNDSRRERQVKLELGSLLTDSGKQLDWPVSLSETEFTLGPCGEKTVLLTVTVDCGKRDSNSVAGTNADTGDNVAANANADRQAPPASIESCLVGYLTVRAEGCLIRPLIVAIAALPDRCGAHRIGCLCGCCC